MYQSLYRRLAPQMHPEHGHEELNEGGSVHNKFVARRNRGDLTIRLGRLSDRQELERLAELDDRPKLGADLARQAECGDVLVALVDGRIVAALGLDSGTALTDPFGAGEQTVEMLRMRSNQLRSPFRQRRRSIAGRLSGRRRAKRD